MAADITLDEYVQIGTVIFATPAYKARDWWHLYGDPPVNHDHVHLLGQDGVEAQSGVAGPLRAILPLIIYGDKDSSGTAYGTPRMGLKTNIVEVKQVTEPKTGDGTQTLKLKFVDDTSVTGNCVVEGGLLISPRTDTSVFATLDLILPDGALL